MQNKWQHVRPVDGHTAKPSKPFVASVIAASQLLDDEVGMTREMLDAVETWRSAREGMLVGSTSYCADCGGKIIVVDGKEGPEALKALMRF